MWLSIMFMNSKRHRLWSITSVRTLLSLRRISEAARAVSCKTKQNKNEFGIRNSKRGWFTTPGLSLAEVVELRWLEAWDEVPCTLVASQLKVWYVHIYECTYIILRDASGFLQKKRKEFATTNRVGSQLKPYACITRIILQRFMFGYPNNFNFCK